MPSQLPSASVRRKLKSVHALIPLLRRAQAAGRTVVFTNGCFDLLHAGHVTLLERAKRLGSLLVVAMNSDRSVRAIKGPHRPIVEQRDRATVLSALESVDYLTVFNDPTPERLIAQLRPDVLVKGADWGAGAIVGARTVMRVGGRVVRIPLLRGYSTSGLVARIQRRTRRALR